MKTTALLLAAAGAASGNGSPLLGKAAFVGVFALLLLWLLFMPSALIDREGARKPWWRNVRFWAIVVTIAQIGVYCYWG